MAVDLDAVLPDLSSGFALAAASVEHFAQHGHVLVRGLAPPNATGETAR